MNATDIHRAAKAKLDDARRAWAANPTAANHRAVIRLGRDADKAFADVRAAARKRLTEEVA